jgi:putative flippase GtrA
MLVKRFLISLFACESIIMISVGALFLLAGRTSLGPEGIRYLKFAFIVGIAVALVSFWVCSAVPGSRRMKPTTIVGGIVGLLTSVMVGVLWGFAAEHWMDQWGHYWAFLGVWVESLQLAIPGAIAGAVIGFLRAQSASRPAVRTL